MDTLAIIGLEPGHKEALMFVDPLLIAQGFAVPGAMEVHGPISQELMKPGLQALPVVEAVQGVEAGHIVLVRSDLRDIPRIVSLSRATRRKMIQNLWWAAGYNIVALPLAAGVAYNWGVLLSPAMGAVLMSASTVIVAVNAQFLRRVDLDAH